MFSRPVSPDETGPNLQQTGYPSPDGHPPFCRLCDAAQNFQQRAFPGAVPTNDADCLALTGFKIDVL
jgi:hypothetical protein